MNMFEAEDDDGGSQADALADVVSGGKSFHVVLEKSPPDYVKKISQYLECSAGPSSQIPTIEGVVEVDSDSGDSLFLTQKPVPHPVRTVRHQKSPNYTYHTELEDGEGDTSPHSYVDDHKTTRKKRKRRIKLPKYSFSFLEGTKCKPKCTHLSNKQNLKFHNYVMGSFFKCLELWKGADDLWGSLPTVDQDNEDISPLTEAEGEDKCAQDIKVVGKGCFLMKSKPKSQQPWYTPPQSTETGIQLEEGGVVTQQRKKKDKMSTKMTISSLPLAKDKNIEICSSENRCNHGLLRNDEPLANKLLLTLTPRNEMIILPEETEELPYAESTSERMPVKHLNKDYRQSGLEEDEDATRDNAQ
ncbi:uncharacterized protein LOC130906712 [Corythoichthys intestinalis]|uniref:uncharacterized protein LOC130906712 n=1 Tax=Corythoichthys intestinalis TaxID=161448 RepID=UPI0025A5ECAE|nr:uncharacterized protein LOC130906712 [Corythoichthys intestinalis]